MKAFILSFLLVFLIGCNKRHDICVCSTEYNGKTEKVFIVEGQNYNENKKTCALRGDDCPNGPVEKFTTCKLK